MKRSEKTPLPELERLVADLDPPDDTVDRIIRSSLRPGDDARPLLGRPLLAVAALALLLLVPLVLIYRSAPSPAPEITAGVSTPPNEDAFSLSNREGPLVLRSPSGQYFAVAGGPNE